MGQAALLDSARSALRQRLKAERQEVFQAFHEDGKP